VVRELGLFANPLPKNKEKVGVDLLELFGGVSSADAVHPAVLVVGAVKSSLLLTESFYEGLDSRLLRTRRELPSS